MSRVFDEPQKPHSFRDVPEILLSTPNSQFKTLGIKLGKILLDSFKSKADTFDNDPPQRIIGRL